jgi:hypothetical protein
LKIKIVVSFFIFSLLVSAAWFLDQKQNGLEFNKTSSHLNRLNIIPINNDMTPLNTNVSTENSNVHWKLYMPFRPREYVRIIAPS